MLARQLEGASNQPVQESQNVAGAVCEPETDFARFMALGYQSGEGQAPHVLARCFDLDLQLFRNLADTKIGLVAEQLQDLDAPMVGKAFDDSFQALGLGRFRADHTRSWTHRHVSAAPNAAGQAMMTFLRMSSWQSNIMRRYGAGVRGTLDGMRRRLP